MDKATRIAALECALYNEQNDKEPTPYALAIISEADLALLQHRVNELEMAIQAALPLETFWKDYSLAMKVAEARYLSNILEVK